MSPSTDPHDPATPDPTTSPAWSGPFRRELSDATRDLPRPGETAFEKERGINRIEVRRGYTGVQVRHLSEPMMASRLQVLEAVAQAQISIDFLKLTRDGVSFVAKDCDPALLRSTLESAGTDFSLREGECVLLVHAVNMRDEPGLLAKIVSDVVATGAEIDHMGDMHDRLLIVLSEADAEKAAAALQAEHPGAGS